MQRDKSVLVSLNFDFRKHKMKKSDHLKVKLFLKALISKT